ncbi:MAG TPA: hypothetical protein VEG29_03815, partial [Candidatus Binatia bacterium]|nr:hypothetical protein [Candidatus Binatia bacterium]
MAAHDPFVRAEPATTLPAFERLASPPPPDLVASAIEAHSAPGDIVVDLHGRGGWVARAAVDRQRRAVSMESNPLTRLLAEVVLRPPDIRHLDAAFQAIAAAPRQQSSLKNAIGDHFATHCATCGRSAVVDEFIWEAIPPADGEQRPSDDDDAEDSTVMPAGRLVRKHYRCIVCRDQIGGGEQRHAPVDDEDIVRAGALDPHGDAWRTLHDRFPTLDGHDTLVDQLLDLHTPRQLDGLSAILERIDADLRSASVEAALRLSLLHALLPASRLNGFPGRIAYLRIHAGRVKLPTGEQWRERNPWLAFEDGYRVVRGFVQRLEGSAFGPAHARFGDDVESLDEGIATVVVRLGTPSAFRSLESEAQTAMNSGRPRPRVRLVVGQPPQRPNQDRLSFAYFATAWLLGREAAAMLPLEALFGAGGRAPWGWQAAALGRSLDAVAPWLGRDGRVVLFLESGGPEALVAAALGGVRAGYRLVGARIGESGEESGGIVELAAPGATLSPGPRTRANVGLPHTPGGAGDPDVAPGRGLFAPPERFDRRPFSSTEAARTVTDTAVEILQARGEPARQERLLGEILVGLDRTGLLRRLVTSPAGGGESDGATASDPDTSQRGPTTDGEVRSPGYGRRYDDDRHDDRPSDQGGADDRSASRPGIRDIDSRSDGGRPGTGGLRRMPTARPRRDERREPATLSGNDQVETVLTLIREELARPDQRRLVEIEPGRWWLADPADVAAAALPLADRIEWAVFSLLSTTDRLSEAAFFERITGLFTGHDLPDETLVRACL